jgi:hypothetical protein
VEAQKLAKYAHLFGADGCGNQQTRFVPLVFSSFGGRGKLAKPVLVELAHTIAFHMGDSYPTAQSHVYGSLSSSIMNSIGGRLLAFVRNHARQSR